jgi:hypothetical protein
MAALAGLALLGGLLGAPDPAQAQQREHRNPLASPSSTDLEVTSVSVDATRATVAVRVRTENLPDGSFRLVTFIGPGPRVTTGRRVQLELVGDEGRLVAGGQSYLDDTAPPRALPADAVSGTRVGEVLTVFVERDLLGWSGASYVSGILDAGSEALFGRALSDDDLEGLGPVTSDPDTTASHVTRSAPSQVRGRTGARLRVVVSPAVAGVVTWSDGTTRLATTRTSRGTAELVLPSWLAVGRHTIRASFAPVDPLRHAPSTAATQVTVLRPPARTTRTTVALSRTRQVRGTHKPVRATVTVSGRPGGRVTLLDGRTRLATLPLRNGRATYIFSKRLRPGVHAVRARFAPARPDSFQASTSRTVRLRVTRR